MITALPDVVMESIDRSVDEFIVLACDGIWNSMSSQEVVDFVRPLVKKGETLSSICEKVIYLTSSMAWGMDVENQNRRN